MNALSTELLTQLADVVSQLNDDPPGAVVVWGGERIFAAGADIAEFKGPDEARLIGGRFRDALDALAVFPRAVIAAVNGYALGGGCELALAADAAGRALEGVPQAIVTTTDWADFTPDFRRAARRLRVSGGTVLDAGSEADAGQVSGDGPESIPDSVSDTFSDGVSDSVSDTLSDSVTDSIGEATP